LNSLLGDVVNINVPGEDVALGHIAMKHLSFGIIIEDV
jgi:hypothetical protein